MRKIIWKLLCFFMAVTVVQAEDQVLNKIQSLTYYKNGRDAEGILSLDRMEIRTSGIVNWNTNSRGFFCPLESGKYKGRISKEALDKLTKLGEEVHEEQVGLARGDSEELESSREMNTNLFLRRNGKYLSTSIYALTEKVKNFEQELWKIKKTLTPESVISMEVKEQKNYMLVKFILQGEGPFKLVLPDKAEEAFSTPKGRPLQYHTIPTKLVVILNAKRKTFDLKLQPFPAKDEVSREVLFQNSTAIHHGGRTLGGDNLRAKEVNMCGVIN
ncbi:MAG: hypothetical protein HYV97_11795 [Bdellovibrio sp.]|nr:hypothetical protein [Bdellovibrio sp.]